MRIAVIPARGGSKRIKNKNIIDFCGKPLISYALEVCKRSELFDKIHVSTDSEEIKNVVESLGYTVDFMRPAHLADDFAGVIPVVQYVVKTYQAMNQNYRDALLILPTVPLLEPQDLVAAYEIYLKNDRLYPTLAVCPFPVPVEWAYHRDDKTGIITPCQPGATQMRSQDFTLKYFDAGAFCYLSDQLLATYEAGRDLQFASFILDKDKVVDIDEEKDLQFAESLFRAKFKVDL